MRRRQSPGGPDEPQVEIKQQRRKSLAMRVKPDGSVVVSIPHHVRPTHPEVKKFIKEGLAKLETHIPAEKPQPIHDAKTVRARVRYWARQMGLKPKRITLREMTRKWGSCSSNGNITLNTALFFVPDHLLDYLIVHELAHMTHFDHGPQFWALVAQYVPDYAEHERALNTYRV